MPTTHEVRDAESRCYCDSCKARRSEPHALKRGTVHGWNYSPSRFIERRIKGDAFPYVIGVELETVEWRVPNGYPLANDMAVDLRRPKNLWYAKYDGSVSGPEFVSHPATLTFWKAQEAKLSEMFSLLVHAGYRSHQGGQAGMHVNISKTAFTNDRHLHRFLTFLWGNIEWVTEVTQRTKSQLERWATPYAYSPATAAAMMGTRSRWSGSPTGKYSLVNAPSGQDRFEFRGPRGTLRIDRFYKNLEFPAALIAYCRSDEAPDLHPEVFTDWVQQRREVYTHFSNFLSEKSRSLRVFGLDAVRVEQTGYQPGTLLDGQGARATTIITDDSDTSCECEWCIGQQVDDDVSFATIAAPSLTVPFTNVVYDEF